MTAKANEQLRNIALELRELAATAHGDPPGVKVVAGKLFRYAEILEHIARKPQPTLQPIPHPTLHPYAGKDLKGRS